MVSFYSDARVARKHIYTVILTCNIEKPQQKYRIGTVSNRLLGMERSLNYTVLFYQNSDSLLLQRSKICHFFRRAILPWKDHSHYSGAKAYTGREEGLWGRGVKLISTCSSFNDVAATNASYYYVGAPRYSKD